MNPIVLTSLRNELEKIAYMTAAGPIYTGNMPKGMGQGMVSARMAQRMTGVGGARSMRRGGIVPKGKTQLAILHGPEAVVPLGKGRVASSRRKVLLEKIKKASAAKVPRIGDIVLVSLGPRKTYANPLTQLRKDLFRGFSPRLQGSFQHAAIYVGDGQVVDVMGEGVRRLPMGKLTKNKDYVVLRTDAPLKKRVTAADFAKKQKGKGYDAVAMIGAGAALASPESLASRVGESLASSRAINKKKFQCGGLVSCAFEVAGFSLSGSGQPGSTWMSPADLLASPKTRIVFGETAKEPKPPLFSFRSKDAIAKKLRKYIVTQRLGLSKKAQVEYRGITFPGYGKPIASNRKGKKKMVLVKRGDKVRIVHFGQKGYQDFTQHKDKKRRKNYLTRSAGIRNKSGQLTKDDPFSPNYWARRELW